MNKIYSGIIFLIVLLFTACDNAFDTQKTRSETGNGYGRVSVIFTGDGAISPSSRTIFPSFYFDRYVYTFTRTDEETGVVRTPDTTGFFSLEFGNYTVAVQAYYGNAEVYTLAAQGVSAEFSVGTGINEPVMVFLSPIAASEQGEFSYTVSYPADAAAIITLQKWPDLSEIALNPVSQGNGKTQTLQLDSGSYLITVLVNKGTLYAGISEAVHIKPFLTTVYTKNFSNNYLLAVRNPVVTDYTISGIGTFIYDGNSRAASVTRTDNVSPGEITIFYNGVETAPHNAGIYAVTLNITAAQGFSAATGLPAGAIIIDKAEGEFDIPPAINTTYTPTLTLADLTLQTGYTWNYPATSLNAGDGQLFTATYTDPCGNYFAASGTITVNVAKANGAIIVASVLASRTYNSITINAVSAPDNGQTVEYARNTTNTLPVTGWQTGLTFSGLSAGAIYYIFARSAEDDNYNAGAAVDTVITTLVQETVTIILVEMNEWELMEQTVQAIANTNKVFTVSGTYSTYRWYIDGTILGSSSSFTFNKPLGVYELILIVTNSAGESRSGRCWVTTTNPPIIAANVWKDGNLATMEQEDWYSFSVTAGTTYHIWWNDSKQGNGKTGDIAVSARYNGSSSWIFGGTNTSVDSGFNTAQSFTANQTGMVEIRVIPYNRNNTGTYGLAYGTDNTMPTLYTVTFDVNYGNGTVPATQVVGVGSIITLPGGSGLTRNGYSFGGWNTDGIGTGTNYSSGSSFIPTTNIILYARWNSNTNHNNSALVENIWYNGTFTSVNTYFLWPLRVVAGTTYRIWWNDRDQGDGTQSGDVVVGARYTGSSSWIFGGTNTTVDRGWSTAQSFTANQNGIVEVRVDLYNITSSSLGSFRLAYSTNTIRP